MQQARRNEAGPGRVDVAIPLPALPVRKEAVRRDEMKAVLRPCHGDIEQAVLLFELRRRSRAEVGRNASVHDVST